MYVYFARQPAPPCFSIRLSHHPPPIVRNLQSHRPIMVGCLCFSHDCTLQQRKSRGSFFSWLFRYGKLWKKDIIKPKRRRRQPINNESTSSYSVHGHLPWHDFLRQQRRAPRRPRTFPTRRTAASSSGPLGWNLRRGRAIRSRKQ